jgi:hypothetical protein
MRSDLPSGTVTFLFTDVEGSTKLLHSLGATDYCFEGLSRSRRPDSNRGPLHYESAPGFAVCRRV